MKPPNNDQGSITYLNSGDWIENLTSLEYIDGNWRIYRFADDKSLINYMHESEEDAEPSNDQLLNNLLQEFNLMKP